MGSLAITDHGNMHGVIKFYQAAREAGIKPIIGCEIYVAPGSRSDRENNNVRPYHLVLLVKNKTGYRNLVQLVTKANLEGFYYRPRVDRELLEQHHEGLIALSACLAGEIPRLIAEGRREDAAQSARWYEQTFGQGNYYLEVQRHPIAELEQVNSVLIPLARELEIPLVATNDTHYLNREDAEAHDLLMCIGTGTTVNDEKRLKLAGPYFYLTSPEEMAELYQDIPEALENTGVIAEKCNLKLEFGRVLLPEVGIPEGQTPDEYLKDLCYQGLAHYYPEATEEIQQRLVYELDVIKKTEFANYFLVVRDIVAYARENDILYGVRGSAAASIVLRCLGITVIDPIKYKLVFERFFECRA